MDALPATIVACVLFALSMSIGARIVRYQRKPFYDRADRVTDGGESVSFHNGGYTK